MLQYNTRSVIALGMVYLMLNKAAELGSSLTVLCAAVKSVKLLITNWENSFFTRHLMSRNFLIS